MIKSSNYKSVYFLIILLLIGTFFIPLSVPHPVDQDEEHSEEDLILFAPMYSTTTYLINKNGDVNHTWSSNYAPGEAVYMLEDNTILRAIKLAPSGAGAGGGVQKIEWDGNKIWDFTYYTSEYLSHHDIEPLPNGNVLILAWEYKTREEAIESGRDPYKLQGNTIKPDHVIEVKPTGPTSGEIVWEWHVWDHLIQDYDPSKDNYGVVEDHPELIDFNFGDTSSDWLHTNSVDYNEEFDQILISVRNFNEIWVIDHSTTSEEAAGHTGGNSGKGGDILYRWGNPRAYRAGNTGDQKFFFQHDATWIEQGYPGEGNILVFNNGANRPGSKYSSVDEIIPPVDSNGNYSLEPGSTYGPEEQIWIYTAENPSDFYSNYVGGAQRIRNGNTIICEGAKGKFFEVTYEKEKIWEYISPYPNYAFNDVFKVHYIEPEEQPPEEPDLDCDGSLNWNDVGPGKTIKGHFQVRNIGGTSSLLNWTIVSYPEWGNWTFNPEYGVNLTPENGEVYVQISLEAPNDEKKEFDGYIRVENQEDPNDYDFIPVTLNTPKNAIHSLLYQVILKLKQIFPFFEQLFMIFSYFIWTFS
jgi:hypothetical protein